MSHKPAPDVQPNPEYTLDHRLGVILPTLSFADQERVRRAFRRLKERSFDNLPKPIQELVKRAEQGDAPRS